MSSNSPRQSPREKLISIALDLLDQHHPEDLSLREVARQAGLTSGAPSHHFGNKLGLLAACAEVSWAELSAQMAAAGDGRERKDRLRALARAYIDYALHHPGPYRLIMSRMFEQKERFSGVAEWRTRVMGSLVALIPPSATDPKHAFRRGLAVWALLHGHITLVLDGAIPDAQLDLLTDDISRMAVSIALLPAT